MLVNSHHYRTIWPDPRCQYVQIIDQTKLPFEFKILRVESLNSMIVAISKMLVRGAPLIGVAASYGIALAMREDDSDASLANAAERLVASRPTAVNLAWAVKRMVDGLRHVHDRRNLAAWRLAAQIAEEDVNQNKAIGQHGLKLIKNLPQGKTSNILTHCNAGWLATVDYGTALAPIFAAHDSGLSVHVWVSETRPRNQGLALTAWELSQHGIPHTVISDNAAGYLIQQKKVDMVMVGADRVTANGDVCNKIGTYLKALAAQDGNIPFYAAVPTPTIDWVISHEAIEIEHRHADELAFMSGLLPDGSIQTVRILPEHSNALNPAFDVTPAHLVTGIITEKGVFSPSQLKDLPHA
jgi:methylthioribose-1-phosphate isomerase